MAINNYFIGALPRLTGTFTTSAGAATDPSGVSFTLHAPDNTRTTYVYGTDGQLVKDSTGVYHVDWNCTAAGNYYYGFKGTGASGQSSSEGYFTVLATTL